eukprot:2543089-Pyramimonas_sp.AAC.1
MYMDMLVHAGPHGALLLLKGLQPRWNSIDGANYAMQSMRRGRCGAVYVVRLSSWNTLCNIACAIYVVQDARFNMLCNKRCAICSTSYVIQSM